MTVSFTLCSGLILISTPSIGGTVLGLGVIEEVLTFLAGDGVRKDTKPCEVVWKRAQEEGGDGVDNSNNDDDETNDLDEDDVFNDEIDSRVEVWKLDATVIVVSLTDSL